MIPDYLYYSIYLIVLFFLTVFQMRVKRPPTAKEKAGGTLLLCLFMIWFVGGRPVSAVFGDMIGYAIEYVFNRPEWNGFDWDTRNVLFVNMFNFMAGGIDAHYSTYFQAMSVIYYLPLFFVFRKLHPNHSLLALVVYLSAFTAFGAATNGFKSGAAVSLFMVAFAYRDKLWISIIFILLSMGFHHSMRIVLMAYIAIYFVKNPKVYFLWWAFCLLMAVGHVTTFQDYFASMETDDRVAKYITSDVGGKGGFRIDFIIYSFMPILMGYYMKYKCKWENKVYDMFLFAYLATNGLWLLCMYANFTNRFASLSWFMYPVVLTYPCFAMEDKKHPVVKNRNLIIMAHLGFTMGMHFVLSR